MAETMLCPPMVRRWAKATLRWCPEVEGALEAWMPNDVDGSLDRVEQALFDTHPELDLVTELGARVAACGIADELLLEAARAAVAKDFIVQSKLRRIAHGVLVRVGIAPRRWEETAPS